jgi:tetratricopeptide (TPR) repeat protein
MDEETLHEIVTALVKAERYEQALEAVETFLAEHDQTAPATVSALVEQGYIYYKMKRFRDSLQALDRAIELDSESGPAWVGRAQALHGLERYEESIAAYRRGRDLAPQDARSLNGLGFLLLAARKYEYALIALDRAYELDPDDFDIAHNRLTALRKLRRYRQFFEDWIGATMRILRNQREQDNSRKEPFLT